MNKTVDFPRLFLGLFLCSLCTVFTIHSNMGLSPWDVFHQGIMMMCLSMLFNALGSYFYISCEMGCGPRDGLMNVLTKKSGLPVGLIRACIELSVLLIYIITFISTFILGYV